MNTETYGMTWKISSSRYAVHARTYTACSAMHLENPTSYCQVQPCILVTPTSYSQPGSQAARPTPPIDDTDSQSAIAAPTRVSGAGVAFVLRHALGCRLRLLSRLLDV